jgi:hypothetical protein
VPGNLDDATGETIRLLRARHELLVAEEYSTNITLCERCRESGPFRPGSPQTIVQMLGYW